ncbi:universal stress protein [Eudoraea chungangensis]|uniref:universal stress protein n=1 Tax=Eudoraea chungangensis TaxID=1481905 RepID=UPI0023EC3BC9|nr:universal stress protein [Eudoraea chungangensis]
MKRILIATDYSKAAETALHTACFLAEKLEAEVQAVNVFEMTPSYMSTLSLGYAQKEKRLIQENRERLINFCARKSQENAGWEISNVHLKEHSIASEAIIKLAEEIKADLIIVGMHRGNRWKEFFMGSTATNLIKGSLVPLLAVPDEFILQDLKSFVYATDFEEADILAIKSLAEIARCLEKPIKLIHISTEKEYAGMQQLEWFKEMLKEQVSYSRISFELILSNNIQIALNTYLNNVTNAILVMLEREDKDSFLNFWRLDMVEKMKLERIYPLWSFKKESLREFLRKESK